ncbi:hypothetical protein DU500_17070 (plasmid) [Haloplanus rubicundus]|uniref:Uncharacterized protein n=1 Tax=Haloplanus rubicundus TaxID=1547898 RepID=A0A345E7N1_9EURY|nr:hypothetical protein DU500_17070 [Haloplanus rubicundus]
MLSEYVPQIMLRTITMNSASSSFMRYLIVSPTTWTASLKTSRKVPHRRTRQIERIDWLRISTG